jgi:hypothetical protein
MTDQVRKFLETNFGSKKERRKKNYYVHDILCVRAKANLCDEIVQYGTQQSSEKMRRESSLESGSCACIAEHSNECTAGKI